MNASQQRQNNEQAVVIGFYNFFLDGLIS